MKNILIVISLLVCLWIGYSYYAGGNVYVATLAVQSAYGNPSEKDRANDWFWNETGCGDYAGDEFIECVSRICGEAMPSNDNFRHFVNYMKQCYATSSTRCRLEQYVPALAHGVLLQRVCP